MPLSTTAACAAPAHFGRHYLGEDFQRLASYREQLHLLTQGAPRRVLLVGQGDGFVAKVLADDGYEVVVLDTDPALRPDVLASVEHMPLEDQSFDVCVCCQVLEHLPFAAFAGCLREIHRVVRMRCVVSLPDIRRFASLRLRVGTHAAEWQISLPRWGAGRIPPERLVADGHHWEIGYADTPMARVRGAIADAGWTVSACRRVHEFSWHTFLDLVRADPASRLRSVATGAKGASR